MRNFPVVERLNKGLTAAWSPNLVEGAHEELLLVAVLLALGVLQVVGVHDANHVLELVHPAGAVVEPKRSPTGGR